MSSFRRQRELTQRLLLLPRTQNGDVEWQTLGNILTAKLLGEVLCASYVDVKHRRARPDFEVDTDWKFSYEENGVVVLRKTFPDSPLHCWMGRTVIDLPLNEIADFIARPESALIFDKYIVESRVVKDLSESDTQKDIILYYRTEAKKCLVAAKRDFLFYIRYAHIDGKYVQSAISVEYPECPPVDGIIRAIMEPGCGWHLEPYHGSRQRTLVSYVCHLDLIGVPSIIINQVVKRQPLNVLYVKSHLLKQKRRETTAMPSQAPYPDNESTSQSGYHFEEAASIQAFTTKNRGQKSSSDSTSV